MDVRHNTRGRRGFTLIEMLISGLIMSLLGMGLWTLLRTTYDSQYEVLGQNTANLYSRQVVDELATKEKIRDVVARREIEKLQKLAESRKGTLAAAEANKHAAETKLSTLLPAEKASAEAAQNQAEVELAKTTVRAGVAGRTEQFVLRPGDMVNPLMRPAGVLIPADVGSVLIAGFGQIEAQVLMPGMVT